MEPLGKTALLMQALRINAGERPVGLLAVEVLAHVAAAPRRLDELEQLTGASNGSLIRAIRSMTVWFERSTGKVHRPNLPLLQRRKTPGRKGHRIWLTCNGRKLLGEVGLYGAE
jgi:hypothetical protein